ncbi:PREDICTED: putative pyridoxal-dependent decarboxylase domain-containing protein 2 [Acropora digitifera]|uniref:putative pyridoxal-dependent decarboxylase domain-containing protein 2 n=1 Tax=Acropora digitifera TaxID=70779 RepID=UPI00077B2395|nr:PREDICTED: putative pyridoxal-dependent decarboxylase domain-containing protein 2 [Acropora digitifera]
MVRFINFCYRKTELSKVLCQISDLVVHEKPQTQFTCAPDSFTHTNVIAATLSSYLSLLDESCIKKLSACIKSDCSHWLAKLFGYENALSCFHMHQWDGLVRVCRLALRVKYPKFGTEGFTALYTRPPVIYISSSACNTLGHYLCTQLGLPQSSVCKVPCNTVFGSPHTMDIAAFERLFNDDVSCGKTPLLLIAYAGEFLNFILKTTLPR